MRSIKSSYNKSWTDDLPGCKNTGIGFRTNQVYREDGNPEQEHPYEDCSCHFKFNDNFYWYTVFDGHEGKSAANFCSQHMAFEVCFSQLSEKVSDVEVKELLRQAFNNAEKGYMENAGDLLAERTGIQCDSEGFSPYEACQNYPNKVERLNKINRELSSGTAAAVCLICSNKLYVANVGNCRVLLCQTDQNNVLKVLQLSVDHDLTNEDELLRLSQLGINVKSLRSSSRLGNQDNTRCLGNYTVKGGYKDFDDLSNAMKEPIIAEPDICGGITLDESCRFLLLMSSGLYKSIEEAKGPDQVNKYIAQCVVEQFREQSTLTGVAQAVVDKVVRLHHDWYMSNPTNPPPKREDITLVLRNFNFPLPNALKSPTNVGVTFNSNVVTAMYPNDNHSTGTTITDSNTMASTISGTDTTSSSDGRTDNDERLGPDQRITAHVDFSDFYKNYEIARQNGTLPEELMF